MILVHDVEVGRETVEDVAVGVDKQSLFGSCHTYVITAAFQVCDVLRLLYEKIYIIKLASFRLMYSGNYHVGIRDVTEILYRRFKNKLLEISPVFRFGGLLKELYATFQIM